MNATTIRHKLATLHADLAWATTPEQRAFIREDIRWYTTMYKAATREGLEMPCS